MRGFPGDPEPLVGSFLKPRFLLLRVLSVFIVQPHHTYAKNLACLAKMQGPSVGRPHLQGSHGPKYHSLARHYLKRKSSPLETSVPSHKCWHLQCELSMALCFTPLFDKNKTPLPILKQRKKHITLLSQKDKIVFFSCNKRKKKKRLEEGNHPGQCQSQLLLSQDSAPSTEVLLPQKTKKSYMLKHHGKNGFFNSEDLQQFHDHSNVYLSGFQRNKFHACNERSQPCNHRNLMQKSLSPTPGGPDQAFPIHPPITIRSLFYSSQNLLKHNS